MSESLLLTTGNARAEISLQGAALKRLHLVSPASKKSVPLLWQPPQTPTDLWPGGGAPWLFPFAGRVWHQGEIFKYALGEEVFNMPLHGFAYREAWQQQKISETQATLTLKDSPATRDLYPFQFHLSLTYTLQESSIQVEFLICHEKALGKHRAMPVALGWHPYFALPFGTPGNWKQCFLSTTAQTFFPVTPVGDAGEERPLQELGDFPLPLQHPSLKSLILGQLKDSAAALIDQEHSHTLTLRSAPQIFEHWVLWSNEKSGYFCLEPWMALPNAAIRPRGVKWLRASESLTGSIDLALSH